MRTLPTKAEGHRIARKFGRRSFLRKGIQSGLAAGLWATAGRAIASDSSMPNVLLITLDTTRFDRLSCYGYTRPTSPNLDALAANSVFYTRAYSTSSWTLPAHASLFTGKFVSSHGVQKDPTGPLKFSAGIPGNKNWDRIRVRGLSEEETTLAQILKQAGYDTGSVVAGPWMKKVFGLNRGFDHYNDDGIGKLNGRVAPEVTDAALNWLQARDTTNPFFLFLNYFDPHYPYLLPKEELNIFMVDGQRYTSKDKRDRMYAAEIRFMDKYIGVLLDQLKKMSQFDNTMIVITADHGEMLGESSRRGHGKSLYETEIRIPQFVKYPRGEVPHTVSDVRTQVIDVMPLILERIGAPTPSDIQGTLPSQGGHPLVAEVYPLEAFAQKGHFQAILEGKFKFTLNSKGNHTLFDLEDDPGEVKNLVDINPERAAELESKLTTYLAALPKPGRAGPEQEIGSDLSETLESLGYLE